MIRPILYLIISCFCALAYAGEKRALIVAVGSYPENSGWNKLSSANDAQLMRIILQRQGFNDKDITILTDEKATKANIIKTMVKLIAQSNKNDVVVFHFSGHGQQITDINGDELDGLDEALIPYDALKQASDKYKGENHLIDDELNEFLKRLRKKVGPGGDVIFILDACHSGTATRGQTENGVIRGTELKFELEGTLTKKSVDNNHKFDEQLKPSVGSVSNISPYVVISASGQQELNMEIKDQNNIGYGSLTFALSKLLATNSKSLSYEALFDQLRNEMCTLFAGKHQQTPQLEGETSRLLFAGKAVEIPSHCRVISVVNSAKVIIDIGELSGLTTGSEISFYPINTVIPEKIKLLAKGTVKRIGPTESDVHFETSVTNIKLKDSWGFVSTFNWPKIYPVGEEKQMRADIVRRASANEPALKVEFEMFDPKTSLVYPSNREFKIGENFQVRIINRGTKGAFFQIIDIQPDNSIALLFDLSKLSPNDLFINAGESKTMDKVTFRLSKPLGVEMFKLVASEKQLDLSPIVTQKPAINRHDPVSEFEEMLSNLYGIEQSRNTPVKFNKINIYTKTFTILENLP
jgi:hypothetical protein